MVNEVDPSSKADYFAYNQFAARDLAIPKYGRPQTLSGGLTKNVRSIAWSSDGKRVVTGTEFKGLRVWEVRISINKTSSFSLPSSSHTPSPHNGHVATVAFSPIDPNILVSGCKSSSAGGCIAIWNLSTPKEPITTFKITGDVLHVAFHPSGRQFAAVCPRANRDEVFFYHQILQDGKEVWELRTDIMGGAAIDNAGFEEINSLRFSNSGKLVCAVSNDGSINAWAYPIHPRVTSPEPAAEFAQTTELSHVEEGKSGSNSRASTPREGTPVNEEPVKDDHETIEVEGEQAEEESIPLAPEEGNKDVEMTEESTSKIPNSVAPSRQPTPPVPPPNPESQSQKQIAAEKEAERRRSKQLVRLRHAICHSASLLSLGFDPLGRYLAVGGQDALLSLFDTRDWICQRTFDVCTGAIRHIGFSPDGELIAMSGDDLYISIVSVFSGALISKISVQGSVNAMSWHPTKNWLAWSCTTKSPVPAWFYVQQE